MAALEQKFPINKSLCYKCKYEHSNGDERQHDVYLCNYLTITGHCKPTRDTDGGKVCGCFEPKKKK